MSVGDDGLPIVELIEWPIIKIVNKVRSLGLFIHIIIMFIQEMRVFLNKPVPSTIICRNTLKDMKSKQKSTP